MWKNIYFLSFLYIALDFSVTPCLSQFFSGDDTNPKLSLSHIELSEGQNSTSILIRWQSVPGGNYKLQFAETLSADSGWNDFEPASKTSEEIVSTIGPIPIVDDVKFYRVIEIDSVAPYVHFDFPPPDSFGVHSEAPLVARLGDETGIDPNSIALQLPSGETIDLSDPRLFFTDDQLEFSLLDGQKHGEPGELVRYGLSVADHNGNTSEVLKWEFEIEKPIVLKEDFISLGLGQSNQLEQNNTEAFKILEASETFIKIEVGQNSPDIQNGQILVSNDSRFPFYWRVIDKTQDPSSQNIFNITAEEIELADIIESGTFFVEIPEPFLTPLSARSPVTRNFIWEDPDFIQYFIGVEPKEYKLERSEELFNSSSVSAVVGNGTGFSFGSIYQFYAEFDDGLKKFEVYHNGDVSVDLKSHLNAGQKIQDAIKSKRVLRTNPLRIKAGPGALPGLPVWIDINLEAYGSYNVDFDAALELSMGLDAIKRSV